MISIATLGPDGSDGCQAARKYAPDATLRFYNRIPDIINAFVNEETDLALIPIYNTREGEIKEFEGCLSVPEFYEPVKRAKKVRLRAMTLDGE